METPWWLTLVQWAAFPVLTALAFGAMEASRSGKHESSTLRQPFSVLLLGTVCALFFGGLLYISDTIGKNETTTAWTNACFAGFALIGLLLVAFYFTDRHRISPTELTFATITGLRKTMRWSDIVEARYSPSMKWFRIEDREGAVARINAMLMGLPQFAGHVLRYAPAVAIDDDTRQMLLDVEAGHLPPL